MDKHLATSSTSPIKRVTGRGQALACAVAIMLTALWAPYALAIQPHSILLEDPRILNSEGFLASHPDQRYRKLGVEAHRAGRPTEARRRYQSAARYADKLSQAAYAEMLWNGEGGAADRPLAYAWMDLAAERGTPWLVAQRENYWNALEPAQRQQALQVGQAVYAEYQDAVAQPRLEREIRTAFKRRTGSRLGAAINRTRICIGPGDPTPGKCRAVVSSDVYYHERFWQPEAYWAWQNEVLAAPSRQGQVEVGDLQALPAANQP